MDKHIYWSWAIKNSVAIICWTVLAVTFNKWWIGLFGILFLSEINNNNKHYRICDKCGKHSASTDDYNTAIDKAIKDGWIRVKYGNKFYDYCPNCKYDH
jgi:hypothetical protein